MVVELTSIALVQSSFFGTIIDEGRNVNLIYNIMDNQRNHDLFLTDIVETDTEYIPLLTPEDEKRISEEEIPEEVPIMTLRNAVLFPGVVIPITVGRD